jgi:UDP-N-acetylmuramoyl-L-alanyl-D-glutamate--2,6-diaminopimelate ligase
MVDYAHTPDGLEQVLHTVRRLAGPTGRVWLVFGARGGRDRGKRPLMGRIAGRLADRVVLTADSPYEEEPAAIAEELREGLLAAGCRPYAVELDRTRAIRTAVREARAGDVVLITGRGPEREQVMGDRRILLDDREVVRRVVAAGAAPVVP